MSQESKSNVTRREVLKAGTAAAALAMAGSIVQAAESVSSAPAAGSQPAASYGPLPTRPLGKTGAKVSVVNLGCGKPPTQRILDRAYELGIRYFDTAASYGKGKSEEEIGKWFERTGKRKEIFLVSKDGVGKPGNLLAKIDQRLEALKTDYLDLYFVHGLGDNKENHTPDWAKSPELKEAVEKLKKSGKVKYVGFSTHTSNLPAYLEAAAEGGYFDAIMMSYNPVSGKKKDEALDKALDACHKAGIGLIAMKTMRGIKGTIDMETIGDLNIFQAVIKAVLSDPRIASACSAMENFNQLEQNTAVGRTFEKPMTSTQLEQLRRMILAAGMAWCPGCEGCRNGIGATHPQVPEITRYLSYFEQDGNRSLARQLYRALPMEARHVSPDVLEAAKQTCAYGVDYPALVAKAAEMLA